MMATQICLALVFIAASVSALQFRSSSFSVDLSVVQPEKFLHHVDVTVNWKVTAGSFNPTSDYISAWWIPFAATYTEYKNVTGNNGTFSFRLLNARYGYTFRYYRGNSIIAETEAVNPDGTYPMQVRVIPVPEHVDQMQVIWTSNRTLGKNTVVRYGLTPELDRASYLASVTKDLTYTQQEMNEKVELPPIPIRSKQFDNLESRALRCVWGECYNDFTASELFVNPGIFHVVTLQDLKPSTKYYYQVGEIGGHMSDVRSFTTRIAPGTSESIQVLYFADAGAGYQMGGFSGSASHNALPVPPSTSTDGARHVFDAAKADPETAGDQVAIMNGDISYARGWPFIWELFHNETEDLFGKIPVLAQYGNHEFDFGKNPYKYCQGPDSGGEAGIATARRFNFKSERHPWYWMAYGPVAFFSISSEHSTIEQHNWLRREFPKVNRTITPWVIVFFHRPIYESNTFFNPKQVDDMKDKYTDLFNTWGVDVVLNGHAHYYERMCHVSNDVCNTWGFRDSWQQYAHVELANSSKHCEVPVSGVQDFYECRLACVNNSACTGMNFDDYRKTCAMITCPLPFNMQYSHYGTLWSMERLKGKSPIYILDGSAGGVFTPVETPSYPLTEYKDFEHWGYSRMKISATSFTWEHHHITGDIVDNVTLTK